MVSYSFKPITFLITLCIISEVRIIPSNGIRQFMKPAILPGFLIVVEKDKGFLSADLTLGIICNKHLSCWSYSVIIKAYIITIYFMNIVTLHPICKNTVICPFIIIRN